MASPLDQLTIATSRYIRQGHHEVCRKTFDWFVWDERRKAGFDEPEPHEPGCRASKLVDGIFQSDPIIQFLRSKPHEKRSFEGGQSITESTNFGAIDKNRKT